MAISRAKIILAIYGFLLFNFMLYCLLFGTPRWLTSEPKTWRVAAMQFPDE